MTTFLVNGDEHELVGGPLTYEHIVKLAGLAGNPTMVFHQRDREWTRSGQLLPGQHMQGLFPGTRFTVCHTGNA